MSCEACGSELYAEEEVFEVARTSLYCRWCCLPGRVVPMYHGERVVVSNEPGSPLFVDDHTPASGLADS